MQSFYSQVQIQFQKLFPQRGILIAGISGGADSMALLHLLATLLPKANRRVHAVHVQHGLRGVAAKKDCDLVVRQCQQLGLAYSVYHSDVGKLSKWLGVSLEEAGRMVRHDCFLEAAQRLRSRAVVLAHHQDDQAETLLFNLVRGAGGQGLAALRSIRPFPHPAAGRIQLVRPLLGIAKVVLVGFLREHKIPWREDQSNQDVAFTRNRIRNKLLPYLEKEFNPKVRSHLANSSDILAREDDYLHFLADKTLRRMLRDSAPNTLKLARNVFLQQPDALQFRVAALLWDQLKIPQKSSQHLERLCQAIQQTHPGLSLPGKWTACVGEKQVHLFPQAKPEDNPGYCQRVQSQAMPDSAIPFGIEFKKVAVPRNPKIKSVRSKVIVVDADKLPKTVSLRSSLPGDFIFPLGMYKQKKPVKKILSELKLSKAQRANWPLLAHGREILWVFEGPLSERIKITPDTKRALEIKIFERNEKKGK